MLAVVVAGVHAEPAYTLLYPNNHPPLIDEAHGNTDGRALFEGVLCQLVG